MGHTIDGSQANPPCISVCSFSIRDIPGDKIAYSHITIKNVTLLNFDPISVYSVHDFHMENITMNKGGLRIHTSSSVFIINNNLTNIDENGIVGRDNEKVTIENNRLTNIAGNGIDLNGGNSVQMIPHQVDLFGVYKILGPVEYC